MTFSRMVSQEPRVARSWSVSSSWVTSLREPNWLVSGSVVALAEMAAVSVWGSVESGSMAVLSGFSGRVRVRDQKADRLATSVAEGNTNCCQHKNLGPMRKWALLEE